MALNKFMHPDNPYKNNRPDFKKFALEHSEFRKVAKQSLGGHVSIDFNDAASLRALCIAMLKSDFNLDVDLPTDRLIPAIPQRINYLLWIKDILSLNKQLIESEHAALAVDIGCGASCIYPLIGNKMFSWRYFATEMDDMNLKFASENVHRNNLQESITVKRADSTLLKTVVHEAKTSVTFCMCNPPFFDSEEEEHGSKRNKPREDCVKTASEIESRCPGGEVEFVKRLIDESLELKGSVRLYTSLLGKKSSIQKLKQYLKENQVPTFSTTEFCQGKTMRWAICWTFCKDVKYPVSLFQQEKKQNSGGYSYSIPDEIQCCAYDLPSLQQCVKEILQSQLEMTLTTINQDICEFLCSVTAMSNTWSHSRRKRRMQKHQQQTTPEKPITCDEPLNKKMRTEEEMSPNTSCEGNAEPLIKFSLELKFAKGKIELHTQLIEGGDKDMLHQILQYIKNRLV